MKRLSKKEIHWFLIVLFFLSSSVLMAQNIDELEAKHAEFSYKGNYDKAGDIAYQLANIYWNQNDKKTAGNYFRKAIEHFEKVEDKKRIAQSFEMLGKVEAASQNFLVAANCFNLASKAYKAIDDKKNYAQMLLHIGSAFIDAKQYNKAVGPLAAAKDKIEELDDSDMLVEAYHLLSLAYERMDDKESALYYLKQMSYIITKDKKKYFEQIQAQKKEQEKTSKELADKEKIIKHQADEIYSLAIERTIAEKDARLKELQLDSLNKQKQLDEMLIKQQEIELENERNVRHITLASLSIFLVFSILLLRANQIRKKTNKILAKQNAEINAQKEEIEKQKNTLVKQNDELKAKQKLILEQQAEIQKIVENLEKANAEITRQKEEVEAQKEEIERSYQTIRSLSVIGQSITSTLQQEALLSIIHRNIVQLMPVDLLGIALLDENKQKLIFNGIDAEGNQLDKYEEYLYEDESPAVKCFMKDREVLVADLTKSSKFSEDYKFYKTAPFQTHAVVYLPLSFDNTPIGVLTVQSKIPNAYTRIQIGMLKTLASYISVALQNTKSFAQLEEAKRTIEAKNRNIVDSIRYAEQIQKAILPTKEEIMSHFAEVFVLYQPKDIVSGDFYWFKGTQEYALVIVADCTGHGVPGAFMSMIGTTMIDETVNGDNITDPATLLEKLHLAIREALQQDVRENEDGMDVCVCKIEKGEGNERHLVYAGAKRPLFIVHQQKLEVIEADRKSIGGRQKETERTFTNKYLSLQKSTMLYLTSDGYADQHNEKNEKFGAKAFKELLKKIADLPAEKQYDELINTLKVYQGKKSQRDDITIIGIRI